MQQRYGTLQAAPQAANRKANRTAKKIAATVGALSLALTLLAVPTPAARAQELAQPGWMDSALSTRSWWKHLVIYEIDTRAFQDSNGDGVGDLKGITQHLDYLRSLGVDAILLDSLLPKTSTAALAAPIDPVLGTPDDFDTLSLEASRRNIRILLTVPQANLGPDLGLVRYWLNRGVAGFRILPAADSSAAAPVDLQALHKLLASAVGQRILIAIPPSGTSAANAPQLLPISSILSVPSATAPASASTAPATSASLANTVAGLRAALTQVAAATHGDQPPIPLLLTDAPDRPRSVLRFAAASATDSSSDAANAKLIATVLLGTRADALIDYGQEIGLSAPPTASQTDAKTDPPSDPEMKWGKAPAPPAATPPPAAPAPPPPTPTDGFGVYRPYVPPTAKPKPVAAAPADPATVAGQENDPNSLLSFYRQLTELHRGNPTLRDGDTLPLDHDAQGVLVWVRKPHTITPLSPAIVVLCNFSSAPVALSLKADMTRLHLRGSFLRTLLRSDNA
ncbi:MAG TPA: alpha-amylase family glycosyl hydrolase, partial [Granulicella sp.]|nr:alpha-amylase family glycosyl hydrolase [Granulicella sp.]